MTALLTLGEVIFGAFEVPEHLTIGGKQGLVIHTLPGGGRIVDAMGAEDAPIRWSGVFSGQQAAERVRLLERLRRSGQRQVLTWDAWRYAVVVEDFEAEIANSRWIPYRISLCVTSSAASQAADWLDRADTPLLTVGALTAGALQAAIGIAGLGIASSNLEQAIAASGSLAQYVTAQAYGIVLS